LRPVEEFLLKKVSSISDELTEQKGAFERKKTLEAGLSAQVRDIRQG
jgi:hypothetical protein